MSQGRWEKINFKNSAGLDLAGMLHAPSGTGPVVVVCHGFTGSKEGGGMALAMGELLGNRGYNVLLFDFRGNGESEGRFEDLTLTGQVDDLRCAVDWCATAGMETVITLGRSFGGTTAICHAAVDQRVAGVCTWAAPASLIELFTEFVDDPVYGDGDGDGQLYALVGEKGIAYLHKGFFVDLENYNVPVMAGKIAPRPLLLIQGENDEVVRPGDAGLIFAGAGEPRELVYLPGADHEFSRHHQAVWELFFAWLDRYCSVYSG